MKMIESRKPLRSDFIDLARCSASPRRAMSTSGNSARSVGEVLRSRRCEHFLAGGHRLVDLRLDVDDAVEVGALDGGEAAPKLASATTENGTAVPSAARTRMSRRVSSFPRSSIG